MLLLIEQNTVTEKIHLIIQTTLKKLQKAKMNYGMKIGDHINEDSQFQELMTMDNTKAENKLFIKSNYLTYGRDPLRDTFSW